MSRWIPLLALLLASTLSAKQPNILFIAVDDLRPELRSYGAESIISPNIDKLAAEGMLFERAYCQVPVCGASRASLLSSVRPTRERFVNYYSRLDEDLPGIPSLPAYFKANGYTTRSLSKIFHVTKDSAESSWDSQWQPRDAHGIWRNYQLEENIALEKGRDAKKFIPGGPAYEKAEAPEDAYFDGQTAQQAIKDLTAFKDSGQPFFLAVGFLKPHLPFNAPAKYWDLYSEDAIQLADNPFRPANMPEAAWHWSGELTQYSGITWKEPVGDERARNLVHGYYACVSFVDAQIGKVLDALDELGLRENTIVILWGDHGYHLGEHGMWCKHANFNKTMNAPLIISAPGYPAGQPCPALVEFVDIYPTLVQLAGLPLPAHLQGQSMVPLLENPNAPWKETAYSRWIAGDSVITERYIYSQWFNEAGEPTERMLYDLQADPKENVNIAEKPENAELVEQMYGLILEGREKALVH